MSERDEEIEDIEVALDALIAVRAEFERQNRREQKRRLVGITASDLMLLDLDRERSRDLARNPLAEACHMAIRQLGKRLNKLGGTELMEQVLGRVSCLNVGNEAKVADILDKAWDDIGEWIA